MFKTTFLAVTIATCVASNLRTSEKQVCPPGTAKKAAKVLGCEIVPGSQEEVQSVDSTPTAVVKPAFPNVEAIEQWTSKALEHFKMMSNWDGNVFNMGIPLISKVVHTETPSVHVDAGLNRDGGDWFVDVDGPYFKLDRASQKFGWLHEIGHGVTIHAFSLMSPGTAEKQWGINQNKRVKDIECVPPSIPGSAAEVIADLSAACYLASRPLFNQATRLKNYARSDDGALKIFTKKWKGQHPPSTQREKYINSLFDTIQEAGSCNYESVCIPKIESIINNMVEEAEPGFKERQASFCESEDDQKTGKQPLTDDLQKLVDRGEMTEEQARNMMA